MNQYLSQGMARLLGKKIGAVYIIESSKVVF